MLELLAFGGLLMAYGMNSHIPADSTAYKIYKVMKRANIGILKSKNKDFEKWEYPYLVKKDKDKYGNKVLLYKLPLAMEFMSVAKGLGAICDTLGCEILAKQLEDDPSGADFKFTILQGHLKDSIEYTNELTRKPEEEGLWVCIGYSRRTLEWINLASNNSSNMLICGTLGSGKSCTERLVTSSIIVNYSPDEVEIWSADLKESTESDLFGDTAHITRKISNPYQAEEFFKELFETAQERYNKIKSLHCTNLTQYNKKSKEKMKRIVVIVDEMGMLDNKLNESFQRAIFYAKMTAQISRGCAISFVISVQKPDQVLDPTFRSYLSVVVGFRVRGIQLSSSILSSKDDPRLCNISSDTPGRGWLQTDREVKIQVPYISENQIEEMMKPYQRQKQITQVAK